MIKYMLLLLWISVAACHTDKVIKENKVVDSTKAVVPEWDVKRDTTFSYDTSRGFIVNILDTNDVFIRDEIIRVQYKRSIHIDKPCLDTLFWLSDDTTKSGVYSDYNPNTPPDTVNHGPCYSGGSLMMQFDVPYRGKFYIDSFSCRTLSLQDSVFSTKYYLPPIKEKGKKLPRVGEEYHLEPGDKFSNKYGFPHDGWMIWCVLYLRLSLKDKNYVT